MKLRYSPRALGDLAAISDYLIERSPAGARAVEETIRTTVRMLEQFPSGGRALQQRPDVRVVPTPRFPFLIFYTTGADELVILHIRHAARAPLTADDL
jgi:toxin ParE1/3/4